MTQHETYERLALQSCGLLSWPSKTMIAYQTRERPNKFFPILFYLSKGITLAEVSNLKNGWQVVVIEFANELPARWAAFSVGMFRETQWREDRGRAYVSVLASTISHALQPIGGERTSLLPTTSLKEWMKNRSKGAA